MPVRFFSAAVTVSLALAVSAAVKPVSVAVVQTPGGPRLAVDGEIRNPRFYYGSMPCLFNVSSEYPRELAVPLLPPEDTANAVVFFKGYPEIEPVRYSNAKLIDLEAHTTNALMQAGDEVAAVDWAVSNLVLKAGHRYRFVVTHVANRFRTYFDVEATYTDASGAIRPIPDYYGDTLGEAVRMGAGADVDFITFSTYTSWGCNDWWTKPGEPENYAKIDAMCRRLIAINPRVMLVPRVMTDAPYWMVAEDPSMRMAFDTGFTLSMSSVSSRPYRKAACEAIGKLARHLRKTFPRNFAGLQISGQNSAEWFYMLSQTWNLSGYDTHTRDAFRLWLKEHGDPDWATAEVPSSAERRRREKDARLLAFAEFRQREMASFLLELGDAAKRATDGQTLVCFFYGYSWEVGGVPAGAAETGHFDFDWLMRNAHGKIDAFSSPLSYGMRNEYGGTTMMSPAESVTRNGYLWFNEIDHRTHREEFWEHVPTFTPYADPEVTQRMLFRDSVAGILRGYGDWWMDLFGRGWYGDQEVWDLRKRLNRLDVALRTRKTPYAPEIALVVHEPSLLRDGWLADRWRVLGRTGFARCGADYGQYLLADILRNPPASVKLFYLIACDRLDAETQAALDALKKSRPDAVFVENVTSGDLQAEAIAARARTAGVHCWVAPGRANICSAEGYLFAQAMVDGPLTVDFGTESEVIDFFTGEVIGRGPILTIPFEPTVCRVFKILPPAERKLRFGVVSDVHIGGRTTAATRLELALRWLEAHGAEAVVFTGDLTHSGLKEELDAFLAVWRRVFPDGRARDGRRVELLAVTGNHDVAASWIGGTDAWRTEHVLAHRDNLTRLWSHGLGESSFEKTWRRCVKGVLFTGQQWDTLNPDLGAFTRSHAEELAAEPVFFHFQHAHPKGTCHGAYAGSCGGEDRGEAGRAFASFPNAVVFSGHSHCTIADERTVWQGAFTSIGAGSCHEGGCDPSTDNCTPSWHPNGKKNLNASLNDPEAWGGDPEGGNFELVDVYADRIVVARRSSVKDAPVAPSWSIPLPALKQGPFDPATRSAFYTAPAFSPDARLSLAVCPRGCEEQNPSRKGEPCLRVEIPSAFKKTVPARPFVYKIEINCGDKPFFTGLAQAAEFAAPCGNIPKETVWLAPLSVLPMGEDWSVSVTPVDCFGHEGRPLAAVSPWRVRDWDFGPDGVGGYPEITVTGVTAPTRIRVEYATHPDGLGGAGDFQHATRANYMGDDLWLPILPANTDRFDDFTVTSNGTYRAGLAQGLVRYARVHIESGAGTVADIRFVNDGIHAEEPVVGSFACSDERVNGVWAASVRTCALAAIPAREKPIAARGAHTNAVLGAAYAYLSDGAKRDRLVWSGDLWWAQRNMYAAFDTASPYMPGSIRMLGENRTPEGYVQACPFPESHGPLNAGAWGPFASDEFAAWFIPVLWDHVLHTGDRALAREQFANVRDLVAYLNRHTGADGVFEQRLETCKHSCGLAVGGTSLHHRSYMNILLWKAYADAAALARWLGEEARVREWTALAERTADAVRRHFWSEEKGHFVLSREERAFGFEANALALAVRFATPAEAARILPQFGRHDHGKFQALAVRGAFEYGAAEKAMELVAAHNWYKYLEPSWKGTRTIQECANLCTKGWGDEAHPDACLAGIFTDYLLGVEPIEPGYAKFRIRPRPTSTVTSAKGRVSVPGGFIEVEWMLENGDPAVVVRHPPELKREE